MLFLRIVKFLRFQEQELKHTPLQYLSRWRRRLAVLFANVRDISRITMPLPPLFSTPPNHPPSHRPDPGRKQTGSKTARDCKHIRFISVLSLFYKHFKTDIKFHNELQACSNAVYGEKGYDLPAGYTHAEVPVEDPETGFSAFILKKDNNIVIAFTIIYKVISYIGYKIMRT